MSEKIVITEEQLRKSITDAYIAGNTGRVIFGILDPISATAEMYYKKQRKNMCINYEIDAEH